MSIKDIRSATLGAQNKFKTEDVEHNGIKVKVQQLSYINRKELLDKCNSGDQLDTLKMQVYAVIYTVVDPETGERVFSDDDYETMIKQPSGGYVDTFSKVALKVLGWSDDEAEAEKN